MTTLNEFLKTDIAFTDDIQKSPTGDIDTIAGLANLKEAVFRRIMTRPGTIVHRPAYGVGLPDFKNAPTNFATQREIASRLRAQLPLDPRIESVDTVSVSWTDQNPDKMFLRVGVSVAGFGAVTLEYTPFNEVP